MEYYPEIEAIERAKHTLKAIINPTPLMRNEQLSQRYGANILLKREDLQQVRSYKIRGAYNKIRNLSQHDLEKGVVCASAGNHAQGVAFSCSRLGISGTIYMPTTTPRQKIEQVKMFGKEFVKIVLSGDTFDQSNAEALKYCEKEGKVFIPPFDDPAVIEGQATIGVEILQDAATEIDYVFVPIGGGGLAAGLGAYFKRISPNTRIVGVEPQGAQCMKAAIEKGAPSELPNIDTFVDGAAVKKAGRYTSHICAKVLDEIVAVPEGLVCSTILDLYNRNAIVVEPAGALSIAALSLCADSIRGKNVVCIVSGSNNDITRMEEIRERSLLYEGLKHYFIIRFPQRKGALLSFVRNVLGPNDDITHFAYSKKNNRVHGPAIVGIELEKKEDFYGLVSRLDKKGVPYEYLNDKPDLFNVLI